MRRVILGALVLLLSHPLSAQPALDRGSRVRVYSADPAAAALRQALIGRVVRSMPDSLSLVTDPPAREVSLPSQSLSRIDVSVGRATHALAGGVIGGLVTGGGFVALACAFSSGSCRVGNQVGGFIGYYAVGAIPGVVVGAMVGSRMQGPERWRTIWTRPRP